MYLQRSDLGFPTFRLSNYYYTKKYFRLKSRRVCGQEA